MRNSGVWSLRLLHYWWPLALGWSVTAVVHRATVRDGDPVGVAVLLFGICAAYSLDRVIDAPAQPHPAWMTRVLVLAGAGSAGACAMLLWRLPVQTAALVPLIGSVALLYPALKRLPLTKAIAVPVVWTWSAVALPFHDGSWFGWRWVLLPVSIPLVLLIASGCLLCDLKDEERDRQSGVASLPVMLGARRTIGVAVALALAAGVLAVAEHRTGLAIGALGLSLTSLCPPILARDSLGPLLVDILLTLPGLLISARFV